MGGRLLTGFVALLLAAGSAWVAPPAAAPTARAASSADSAPTVTMTALNYGQPSSLLDPRHPAWAPLSPPGAVITVTATVHLHGQRVGAWDSHLDTPNSYLSIYLGITPHDCRGSRTSTPTQIRCDFVVLAAPGLNRLAFTFTADDGSLTVHKTGTITGGTFAWKAGWEVLDATGHWSAIPNRTTVSLPATLSSAMRYVVRNTGEMPFVVTNGCDRRIIPAHGLLECTVRGVRPAQSLARSYAEPLTLEDAAGDSTHVDLTTRVRSFAGAFGLDSASVTIGQVLVVRANGLPAGEDFAMQFRIDDEPVLVGTSITRTGSTHLSFPLPSTSIGPAHLDVVHDGLTIASLPFEVTRSPRAQDAAAPVWPWLLIPLGLLVGLTLLLRRQALRARHRPDPYRDATPATQEPEAAHRS